MVRKKGKQCDVEIQQYIAQQQLLRRINRVVKQENKESHRRRKVQNYYHNRKVKRRLKKFLTQERERSPHPMIIIPEESFLKFEANCIVLKNMKRDAANKHNLADGGMTNFTIGHCGRYVKHLLRNSWLFDCALEMKKIENGFLLVLCQVNENCLQEDNNVCFSNRNWSMKDFVLLMICVADIHQFHDCEKVDVWDNIMDLKLLRTCKKSTVKIHKKHHYGSTGYCYSFGVRNAFRKDISQQVSITKYVGDDLAIMKDFKNYVWKNLFNLYKSYDGIIDGVSSKLNLMCGIYRSQSKDHETLSSYFSEENYLYDKTNIISGNINITAKTKDLHCERDTTYTSIFIPEQKDSLAFVIFDFNISQGKCLRMKFPQNSGFSYSGYCIAHRQFYVQGLNCMNLSTYCGRRLYCNYRQSLYRLEKIKTEI